MDQQAVVASFFASWEAQDVELTSMHFHEDIIYELHSVTRELPYAGVTRGREACRDIMFTILKDFDYLKYEARINRVEGEVVRTHVSFIYRHRESGEVLEGTRRLVFVVRDGFIVRLERFHDDECVDAFIRLTRQRAATNRMASPLALQRTIRREREKLGSVDTPISSDDRPAPRQRRRDPRYSRGRGSHLESHAVVASWIACWAAQDVEMTLAHLHQDIVYKVHASALPFGGEKCGHDALRELMFTVLADFDVLLYEPSFIRVDSAEARAHVSYVYRHRTTGEVLEGTRRLLIQIRDGLILRIDGYYDDHMVEAFMRLTRYRIATNQVVRAPELPKRETQRSA
jgi:ketosteroid isomerase-like protein